MIWLSSQGAQAALSREPFFVRGTPIEMPFHIRILIRELSAPFEIRGHELYDHLGRSFSNEKVKCQPPNKRRSAILGQLGDFLTKDYWICSSQDQSVPLTNSLGLYVKGGFLHLDKNLTFRGHLTLVPKNGKILLVNELPVEEYLVGLINKEIRSDYPAEAIKAQIIAARSYALATAADLRAKREYFDLYGSELDQVYEGSGVEDARSHRLVRETRGQVLFHQDDVLKAFFHSSNGGYSELPGEVWAGKASFDDTRAYLARRSEWDTDVQLSKWKVTLSNKMGMRWPDLGEIKNIQVLERSPGRRVKKILMEGLYGSHEWSGTEFRQKFGIKWIKSTLFSIHKNTTGWQISGRGFGHGVGLSQLGAKEMAKAGKTAQEILKFYYPHTSIRQLLPSKSQPNPLKSSLSAR